MSSVAGRKAVEQSSAARLDQIRLRAAAAAVRRVPRSITAAGLVVATPTFIAYAYLSSRVNSLMHEMERAGIEVVHMLTDREPKGDIITFQPSAAEREAR